MRLDVVDLLVAQYPGTAPTRILLVGTSSTCTTAVDLGTVHVVLYYCCRSMLLYMYAWVQDSCTARVRALRVMGVCLRRNAVSSVITP